MNFWSTLAGLALAAIFAAAGGVTYYGVQDPSITPSDAGINTRPDVFGLVKSDPCVRIIQAGTCGADKGEVRPNWPLPEKCTCHPWSCWLPAGVASSAQDLTGDLSEGLRIWRVLWPNCADSQGVTEEEFMKAAPLESLYVEASGTVCIPIIGTSGRCKIQASKVKIEEVVSVKAELPGGFGGSSTVPKEVNVSEIQIPSASGVVVKDAGVVKDAKK